MTQNIGAVLGQLVGNSIKQACNTGKSKPVQTRVTKYSKPGKRPMPQPAYSQHVKTANPFTAMLASGALSTHMEDDDDQKKPAPSVVASPAKKMPARGPIRGTKLMRPKKMLRTRSRNIE